MTSFAELASKQAEIAPETVDLPVMFGGETVTLRFTAMAGEDWADLAARHPRREDSPLDVKFGYNHTSASAEAAKMTGVLVDGDSTETLTSEQWDLLMTSLDGSAYRRLVDALWTLNEWVPLQRVSVAKKGSPGTSKRKQS